MIAKKVAIRCNNDSILADIIICTLIGPTMYPCLLEAVTYVIAYSEYLDR